MLEKNLLIRPIGGFGDGKREEIGRSCCLLQDMVTRDGILHDAGVLVRRLELQQKRKIDVNPNKELLRECIKYWEVLIRAVVVSHAHHDHIGALGNVCNYVLDGKPHNYKLTEAEEDKLIPAAMSMKAFQFYLRVCYNNARQELLKRGYDENSDEYRRWFGRLVWNFLPYNLRDGFEIPKEDQYIKHNSIMHFGGFDVIFYEVNHSIPETFWIVVEGYGKRLVFCSDFRLAGFKPEEDKTRDAVLAIAARGPIDCVIMESLYSSVPGFTGFEYETVEEIERIAKDRIGKGKKIILTYHASNIRLMEEFYEMSERLTEEPMAFVGRSMDNAAKIAGLQAGPPDSSQIISMTGCQAEGGDAPSALVSRAKEFGSDYVVVFASGAIDGNESAIYDLVTDLSGNKVEVIMNNGEREYFAREGYGLPWRVGSAHTHESGHERADGKRWVAEQFAKANIGTGRKIVFTPYHGGNGDYRGFVQNVVPVVPGVEIEVKIIKNGDNLEI